MPICASGEGVSSIANLRSSAPKAALALPYGSVNTVPVTEADSTSSLYLLTPVTGCHTKAVQAAGNWPPITAPVNAGAATQPFDGFTQAKPPPLATTFKLCAMRFVSQDSKVYWPLLSLWVPTTS